MSTDAPSEGVNVPTMVVQQASTNALPVQPNGRATRPVTPANVQKIKVAPAPNDSSNNVKEQAFGSKAEENSVYKIKYKDLLRYATPLDWFLMTMGVLFAVGAGVASPLTTVIFGDLINTFSKVPQPGQYQEWEDALIADTSSMALKFIYIAIVSFVMTYLFMATWIISGNRITHKTRQAYLQAVLRQDIGWHDSEGAGEVATRITTDMALIQEAISEKVPTMLQLFFQFMTSFTIALIKSWKMTLVLLSVVPLIAISATLIGRIQSKVQANILQLYSKAGSVAEESIASVRTVTAFGAQEKISQRYGDQLQGATKLGVRKTFLIGCTVGLLMLIMYCAYALAFWYGSILLNLGAIDGGTVVNVFFSVLIGSFSLGGVAPDAQAVSLGTSAGAKIFETLDRIPTIDALSSKGSTIPEDKFKGNIQLKNIEFTYPARKDVKILKNFSLDIEAGTTVALVGESGSGKSTIIQLLERFYDPQSGSITIDGVNITDINLKWLRQHIGYVSQEPTLFEGTVFENIIQGLVGTPFEHAGREEQIELVQMACKSANAHDFIKHLPHGYDTEVGERGLLLSGGQKQRIAIARAIIKDPKILLLDEATSALDTTSERIVQAALESASKGRTTIVIAHRLSTVRNADKIICMIRGSIVESGNHDSLVAQGGFYKRLVDAQQIQSENDEEGGTRDLTPEEEVLHTLAVQDQYRLERSKNNLFSSQMMKSQLMLAGEERRGNSVMVVDDMGNAMAANYMSGRGSVRDLIRSGTKKEQVTSAATVSPTIEDGLSPAKSMKTSRVLRYIMKLNFPEIGYSAVGFLAATASGLVQPIVNVSFSSILKAFAEPDPPRTQDCDFWAGVFLIVAGGAGTAAFLQVYMFGIANERLTERIRKKLFRAILRQNVAYFDDEHNSTGVLTSNLATDAQRVQGAAGTTVATTIQLLATLLGGLGIAFVNGWKLSLIATLLLPFLIITGAARLYLTNYFGEKAKLSYEQSAQMACEAVAAIRTVQSLTREGPIYAKYVKLLEKPLKDGVKGAALNTIAFASSQSVSYLGDALLFWYGGHLIANEGYDVRSFFIVFMSVIFGSMSASRIFAFIPDFAKAKASAASIISLLERRPFIDSDAPEGTLLDKENVHGCVEFRDVKFFYPTRRDVKVLRGLTIRIMPGQFVGLVGPSGCGKSTTIGLLERFYDPVSGSVMLDGKDIRDLNIASYRECIGLVSQEPSLFDMSVEDNICLGCKERPSMEEIERAATEANVHKFILSLPEGYKTKVGSKGSQLSGGQKQRIAIARALIRNPKILLLDEATSALDAESERVVQAALDKASKGRTTIAIAHRLSSIQHADVIYVLKDGKVLESGTHQELYHQRGLYYELAVQQDLGAEGSHGSHGVH